MLALLFVFASLYGFLNHFYGCDLIIKYFDICPTCFERKIP
jgi:hypothetical protein